MIEKLPGSSENLLGFRHWGKLTEADYRNVLIPEIEKALAENPKIRVLVQCDDKAEKEETTAVSPNLLACQKK